MTRVVTTGLLCVLLSASTVEAKKKEQNKHRGAAPDRIVEYKKTPQGVLKLR